MFNTLLTANISIAVSCLFFVIFLFFLYISKTNMRNIENSIYKLLIFWNIVHLILYLFTMYISYVYYYHGKYYSLTNFLFKAQMSTMLIYFYFLAYYLIVVTNSKRENFAKFINGKYKRLSNIIIWMIGVLIVIGQLSMPLVMKFDYFNGEGTAGIYWYIIIAILLITAITTTVLNRGFIEKKKLLPFIVLFILTGTSFVLLAFNFYVSEKELIMTLVTYLMYHSIENPDMKLVNELTLAKESAEKANNAKSDFLSSMSHELRTPINAIVGLTQLIDNSTDNPEIKQDTNDILKASNTLLELVDGILDINNLDSNNTEIVSVNYKPLDLLFDIEKNIRVRIGEKPIEFRCRFSDDLPATLNGDKNKIKSIITNLLTNAVKYTDNGYIEFNVDCINKDHICNLRISVSDSGKGISDTEVDKIFDKFYRSDENKDSDISGTGLGLSITKSLVELMEGKITVNSTEGMGSTFMVTLSQDIVENNSDNNNVTDSVDIL